MHPLSTLIVIGTYTIDLVLEVHNKVIYPKPDFFHLVGIFIYPNFLG